LAGAMVIGPRIGKYGKDGKVNTIPAHNIPVALLGCFILAFGWFGFNPGSTLAGSDLRISIIAVNTMLASASGAVIAALYMKAKTDKWDPGMMANGMLAGLVAITPASGFVSPMSSIIIGILASVVCYAAVAFKNKRKWDDVLDTWGVHGVGGLAGALLTGTFAEKRFTPWGHDGAAFGNPFAFVQNAVGAFAALAWCMGVTAAIIKIMDMVWPGGLRVTPKEEELGLDLAQHGERAYVTE